jgi:hypothetical protein
MGGILSQSGLAKDGKENIGGFDHWNI